MAWDDDFPEAPLAPTVCELGRDLRAAIARLGRDGWRAAQLAASGPNGLRPRDMTASARRDLALALRRAGLVAAGLDLWIPIEHLQDASTVDRAIDAVRAACGLAGELGRCSVTMRLPEATLSADVQDAMSGAAAEAGVRLAVSGAEPPPWCVPCVDPPVLLEAGEDPVAAAANPLAAARFCDLVGGVRSAPGAGGSLDVLAYRTACRVAAPSRPVVADLRFLADPTAALSAMRHAWDAAG